MYKSISQIAEPSYEPDLNISNHFYIYKQVNLKFLAYEMKNYTALLLTKDGVAVEVTQFATTELFF